MNTPTEYYRISFLNLKYIEERAAVQFVLYFSQVVYKGELISFNRIEHLPRGTGEDIQRLGAKSTLLELRREDLGTIQWAILKEAALYYEQVVEQEGERAFLYQKRSRERLLLTGENLKIEFETKTIPYPVGHPSEGMTYSRIHNIEWSRGILLNHLGNYRDTSFLQQSPSKTISPREVVRERVEV